MQQQQQQGEVPCAQYAVALAHCRIGHQLDVLSGACNGAQTELARCLMAGRRNGNDAGGAAQPSSLSSPQQPVQQLHQQQRAQAEGAAEAAAARHAAALRAQRDILVDCFLVLA